MAEQQNNSTERPETVAPHNPPNSVLRPEVRTAAFWVYFGPILVICFVVGMALLYWMNRGPAPNADVTRTIGTVGDADTPGGGSPDPQPDNTIDELKYRGAKNVELEGVRVIDARDATTFWIQDGDSRVEVIAPSGSDAMRAGMHVDVSGVREPDERGGMRIRASRVTAK